jgi:hypothetical protein
MIFTGEFNYQGELVGMETDARTERQAWLNFCYGLAKQHGVRKGVMTAYFNGQKDNFKIKEVTLWKTSTLKALSI